MNDEGKYANEHTNPIQINQPHSFKQMSSLVGCVVCKATAGLRLGIGHSIVERGRSVTIIETEESAIYDIIAMTETHPASIACKLNRSDMFWQRVFLESEKRPYQACTLKVGFYQF